MAAMFFSAFSCVSRTRSKGSLFHSGGLGVEAVFARRCATVRNRSGATVRGPYGRAYGEFCKSGHFWSFQMPRSLVSHGRRGTS